MKPFAWITVKADPQLKEWIREETRGDKRGMSGFVIDAITEARAYAIQGKARVAEARKRQSALGRN